MNSSTSSSERAAGWKRFAGAFALASGLIAVGLLLLAVALDPYDTGRLALLRVPGVPEQGPRTAHASRGRDPAFDGALFGNSHLQLVSPERLTKATGIPFVSLTVPATGSKEQMELIRYFLRHRERPARALVIGVDGYWCTPDPALPNWKPFPFWLYSPDLLDYVAGLVRWDTLENLGRRIQYAFGGLRRARPDGYWDYEQYRVWDRDRIAAELAPRQASSALNPTGRFPAFAALEALLARASPDLAVVLVNPPVYQTALPEPGTDHARSDAACRAAAAELAARRPRTAFVDWRDDRPENRDIANYFDHTHYRAGLAQAVEADIAAALRRFGADRPS